MLGTAISLSIAPIIGAVARAKAEARGLILEIDDVSVGFGSITFRGVHAASASGEAIDLKLDTVRIDPTWTLGVEGISTRGGQLVLRGTVKTLRDRFGTMQSQPSERRATSGATRRNIAVDGLSVVWHPGPTFQTQHIWGLSFRAGGEAERASFDLARVVVPGLGLEMAKGFVQLRGVDGLRTVERATAESVKSWVDLDRDDSGEWYADLLGAGRSREPQSAAVGGGSRGASAAVRSAASSVGNPDSALPHPPANSNGGLVERPKLAGADAAVPGGRHRRGELRRRFDQIAQGLARIIPSSGSLELAGLELELRNAGQKLNVGPASFTLSRANKSIRAALRPGPNAASGVEVKLDMPLERGPVNFSVAGGPVSLSALGVREGDFGLEQVERARFEAQTKVRLVADGSSLSFEGVGKLRDLSLNQPKLSPKVLRHINLGWSGKGILRFDQPRLEVESAQFEVGAVRLELSGSVERGDTHVGVDMTAKVPLASCQTMLESAPAGLFPALSGLRMSGTFSLDTGVVFDTRRPTDIAVKWKLNNHCRVTQVPANIDPRNFRNTFSYDVQTVDGAWIDRQSGPGTEDWTYYGNISKYMEVAILVCEDGRFFRHDGFDQFAIKSAIQQNLEAGKFLRGASTVSMQLAKNLYLGREKTLARKLQEAVFTMMLEQQLTKEQIFELYLNVIEFGPGLYGIGPAATFYFNKAPMELSLAQSLYLASLLPNPKFDHFDKDGALSPRWMSYLRRLMRIAATRGLISEEELETGLEEQLVFGRASSHPVASGEGESHLDTELLPDPYERGPDRERAVDAPVRLLRGTERRRTSGAASPGRRRSSGR